MFYTQKAMRILLITPVFALTACGSNQAKPEEILAKAEAAATRAEEAQKAAEAAAEVARGKYRQIAQAESNSSDQPAEEQPARQEVPSQEVNVEPSQPENSEVVRD